MTDEELITTRLCLRGEEIFLLPENRPVSSWVGERGWRQLQIPLGKRGSRRTFKYARVKFRLAHGWWPVEVDHDDRDRGNDLLSNLVASDRSANNKNRSAPKRALPMGVYKAKRGAGYYAAVTWNRKRHHLGYHPTPAAASVAVQSFRQQHCGAHACRAST